MKHQFIDAHRDRFALRLLCRVLGVSASAYYAWRDRPPSPRDRRDAELMRHIGETYEKSCRRYGSPRVHRELQSQGIQCSEKRVARLMKAQGLRVGPLRRFVVTTQSNPVLPVAPNLLDRQFEVSEVAGLSGRTQSSLGR